MRVERADITPDMRAVPRTAIPPMAALVYNAAAKRLHGKDTQLNVIGEDGVAA